MTKGFAGATAVVALAAIYLGLQVAYVRPHLWPAGAGARIHATSETALIGRPPMLDQDAVTVAEVLPGGPADRAGIREGDVILEHFDLRTRQRLDLRGIDAADHAGKLRAWRETYRMGVRDPLAVVIRRHPDADLRTTVLRPAAWRLGPDTLSAWAQIHISDLLQIVVFIGLSAVLLALRATGPTAVLSVLALTLCAVAAGGPAYGAEYLLPPPLRQLLTLLAWTATPLAFVATSFAIGYFPRKSALLIERPWLLAVPFLVTAPMLVFAASAALFLIGADAVLPIVVWDATHPWLFFTSFAVAIAMNLVVVGDGVRRFRCNQDLNERRRIAISVMTIVPGVLAFAIKDGLPGIGILLGFDWTWPWWLTLGLQLVVLLPAFGLTYAVAVHRVFSPATVLRRSVQYALARKTMTAGAMLPAVALVASFVQHRDMSIAMLVSGRPLFYLLTTAALVVAIRYRDAERLWLDRRFFREAYDAREILLSLATRVTYETDPRELTALVVDRIDTALHPEMIAVLVGGLEEGRFQPISSLRATAPALPADSGLVTMLRWSNEPLELYVSDERSPARRLPAPDQTWLETTGAVLLVPVVSRSRDTDAAPPEGRRSPGASKGAAAELVALMALGTRKSEEPYTAEDRQLLASIAAQMGLALDVARLRQRVGVATPPAIAAAAAPTLVATVDGLMECPECGRTAAPGVERCPDDGVAMRVVAGVPHVIERKYRIDRVIGRGGMGAVYRARDVRLERDVAIKVVRADLLHDTEARSRFRREAQIVARLQHPGIVSVFDYGTFPDGSAYLVMELVRGEDLRRVLRRDGPLPVARVVPLAGAMCAAVQAAHREGVLHRDLKPENILLVDADREPRGAAAPAGSADTAVKVLDFGVAKLVRDRPPDETALGTLTGAGVVVGTPAYMAPEQLRSGPVDARTDVFSLGVIIYEMLTGDLPFGRTSLWDIGLQQTEGMKPIATPHGPVPRPLEQAIGRALALDPRLRPQSAAELAALMAGVAS
ncbi:MAG: protein kinase domain-containing protein [Vicinamibacterales bacterium]